MSTFNGLVAEFPDIRVDFFRQHADLRPPLACFLSHIHSDHLAGLESLRSPFVYCSAATREMLLRLERFPCRLNYAKGILEARVQRYKHLKTLLKPLPMETPVVLELEPANHVQVTLFNANHCTGAVMFLFEGQGKAVLYTGDIRSEPWFVNAIARSPCMVEYTSGLKTLDTVYLDTSFIDDCFFPSKADGIKELLQKTSEYPPETVFHFQAWTYGYEDVWIALSKALGTQIHVDEYKFQMYGSLVAKDASSKFGKQFYLSPEAAGLMGFMCGNTFHPGCLTLDENVRLHSCEKGNYCQKVLGSPVVRIQPVVTRLPDGQEIAEAGVGGGGDDLNRDAELDYLLPSDIQLLIEVISNDAALSGTLKDQVLTFLTQATASGRKVPLDLDMTKFGENGELDFAKAVQAIAKKAQISDSQVSGDVSNAAVLPSLITFPYSRHSSYSELCHLLKALNPKDVWPCTVHLQEWLERGSSIKSLFGQHCCGSFFRFDELMEKMAPTVDAGIINANSQATTTSAHSPTLPAYHSSPILGEKALNLSDRSGAKLPEEEVEMSRINETTREATSPLPPNPTGQPQFGADHKSTNFSAEDSAMSDESAYIHEADDVSLEDSQDSTLSEYSRCVRIEAFDAMLRQVNGGVPTEITLLSTRDNHSNLELELGES